MEEDTAGPYIIKRGPIKIVQEKSQNEKGGKSLSCSKLNRTKKRVCIWKRVTLVQRSPCYEVKGSHNTKIYKLKEILKNLIKVKVLSMTKTLFSEGSRKVNHT